MNSGEAREIREYDSPTLKFSGLRPESLEKHTGTDDLRLGDPLKDVEIKKDRIEFSNPLVVVVVRETLSKSRCQYFTNVPGQGTIGLKDYLEKSVEARY